MHVRQHAGETAHTHTHKEAREGGVTIKHRDTKSNHRNQIFLSIESQLVYNQVMPSLFLTECSWAQKHIHPKTHPRPVHIKESWWDKIVAECHRDKLQRCEWTVASRCRRSEAVEKAFVVSKRNCKILERLHLTTFVTGCHTVSQDKALLQITTY